MMTIAVYHLRYDAPVGMRESLEYPTFFAPGAMPGSEEYSNLLADLRAERARGLFESGDYVKVATVTAFGDEETAMANAVKLTRNGLSIRSWSLSPPPGVIPERPGYFEVFSQRRGRTERIDFGSTSVGALMELEDGRTFVMNTDGFRELPPAPETALRPGM